MAEDDGNTDQFVNWKELDRLSVSKYEVWLEGLLARLKEREQRQERQQGVKGASAARSGAERADAEPARQFGQKFYAERGFSGEYAFDTAEKVAHAYGAGPVTVSAGEGGIEHLKAVAKAVRAWNQATGVAVFKLVEDPNADVVISVSSNPNVGALESGSAAGSSNPNPGESSPQNDITLNAGYAEDARVITHELGHAATLGHPGPNGDPYRDSNSIMGSGSRISLSEAALVRRTFENQTTPQLERMGPRGGTQTPVQKAKAEPKRNPQPAKGRRKQQI